MTILKKPDDIEIPEAEPFDQDKLARNKPIKNLTKIVSATEQPFVLAVEAPWGHGKTTFVRMWKQYLENQGHCCVYFNAWESDFTEDPLVPFISEMTQVLEAQLKAEDDSAGRNNLDKAKRLGAGFLRGLTPLLIRAMTQGVLQQEDVKSLLERLSTDPDQIADLAASMAEDRLKLYEAEKKSIAGFRKNLEEFSREVIEGDFEPPLVFFIDELDRCRPDYAVLLLERVKHLFSVPGIFFVLSVDWRQLSASVQALYGQEMDTDGYLRRFVDLRYKLPEADLAEFVRTTLESLGIQEPATQDTQKLWVTLANLLGLSLRDQQQCLAELVLLAKVTGAQEIAYFEVLMFMLAFRSARPDDYERMVKKEAKPHESVTFLLGQTQLRGLSDSLSWIVCDLLVYHFLQGRHKVDWEDLEAYLEESTLIDKSSEFSGTVRQRLGNYEEGGWQPLIARIRSQMTFAKDFSL